jgi:hypothetical protein
MNSANAQTGTKNVMLIHLTHLDIHHIRLAHKRTIINFFTSSSEKTDCLTWRERKLTGSKGKNCNPERITDLQCSTDKRNTFWHVQHLIL